MRSDDGGRTWAPVAGAPVLVVLAWSAQGSLYGVTPDGAVQHSVDGGATWAGRGAVDGAPEALAVSVGAGPERLYVAVEERGIVSSDDGGATFTVRYAE